MKTVELTADVYSNTEGIAYRLYVDNTLMTERTFKWEPRKKCVEEHMILQVTPGSTHTVRIESVNKGEHFTLKNITVDGVKSDTTFLV
jgi:hypothetical protein